MFRRYTEIVGGLLAVGGEIGLSEAGQDAELVRAVSAATAFSRAKELADREREGAAQAAAGRRLDQAERTRLAFLAGRQDALLDQFAALATPAQMAHYARAFATGEVDRAARLRKTALEAPPGQSAGPDLAGWSNTAATRVERMREIEPGLTAEVTRLASLTDRSADRRVLAYAAAFLLAASALVVLLVLAPGRARRARGSAQPSGPRPPRRQARGRGAARRRPGGPRRPGPRRGGPGHAGPLAPGAEPPGGGA